MFGMKSSHAVMERPSYVPLEKLGAQETVDHAIGAFKLVSPSLLDLNIEDDLVLKEGINDDGNEGKSDNRHIRTDYVIHPRSAIRRTNDGRFSFEAIKAERLDDLTNLYFNPEYASAFFDQLPERYLTEDGWELFTLKGQEFFEVNSEPYEQCGTCHETMPNYHRRREDSLPRPSGFYSHSLPIQETRTFKLKTPLQELLRNAGMVITRVDHPCYHSLQDLLRPEHAISVDPPVIEPVFPKDISF